MPLAPRTRLGPYEIVAPLGRGGMGEVYRARDTRLGRDVALKVLPSGTVSGEEDRLRFEREARTVSRLSHPNVCPLFDVGREGDTPFLVMELLEGETLAARLARGPLPLDAVLRHGAEIAAALAAAHARGIVHRDLKPANVMLTPTGARLMDFGLARAFSHAGEDTLAPTGEASLALTATGVVVGTVPYMAPEQIRGGTPDARTDLFALGAVLHEMATGVRAFGGSSEASVMSAVLTHEPPAISSLVPDTPPPLDRIVARCLAKDPAARWASAADLEFQLRELAGATTASGRRSPVVPWRSRRLAAVVLGAVAVLAIMTTLLFLRRSGPDVPAAPSARFRVWPPPGTSFWLNVECDFFAVSPDGRRVAFVAVDSTNASAAWIRSLDELAANSVPGTSGARAVFWSPDGRELGFVAGSKLQRVALTGGPPTPICDVPAARSGLHASWGSRGDILFSTISNPAVYRVSANGGSPVPIITADSAKGEFRATMPRFLPDGKHFLCTMVNADGSGSILWSAPGESRHELVKAVSRADFTEPDQLLYVEDGTLFARRFDWKRGRVLGGATAVVDTVGYFFSNGSSAYAASPTGTLVYHSSTNQYALRRFDRTGRDIGGVSGLGDYLDASLSSSDDRLLFSRSLGKLGTYDVWLCDLRRGTETRLTPSINSDFGGVWVPGGRQIVYSSRQRGMPRIVVSDLETGRTRPLAREAGFQVANDVSPDGRTLLFWEGATSGESHLWQVALAGGAPKRIFPESRGEHDTRFSPDGRWIAFLSPETGRDEVYVTTFPEPGSRIRVSTNGAMLLRWARKANEIVYFDGQRRLIAVPVRTGTRLELGEPRVLFTAATRWLDFDVTPDGSRIVAVEARNGAGELPMTVLTRWPQTLEH